MADVKNKPVLTFSVFRGHDLVKSVTLSEESVTIGSGPAALLSIEDKSLADLHAVVNVEDHGVVHLFDLGSEAGTKVNGQTVSNVPLNTGDTIEVGDVRIVVDIEAAPRGEPAADAFDDEEATYVAAPPPHEEAPAPAVLKAVEEDPTNPGVAKDEDTEEAPASATPAPAPTAAAPEAAAAPAAEGEAAAEAAGEEPVYFDESIDDYEGEHASHVPEEDVISFIMRSASQAEKGKGQRLIEVNQVWGNVLLETKHYKRGSTVTIGSTIGWRLRFFRQNLMWLPPGTQALVPLIPIMGIDSVSDWASDFYAADDKLPKGSHEFALIRGGTMSILHTWDGFVDIGDQRYSFEDLVAAGKAKKTATTYEIGIDDDTRVMVDVDGMIFFVQMTSPGKRIVGRIGENLDYTFMGIFSFFAFLGIMMAVLMVMLPPAPESESVQLDDRFVELLMEKPEPDKPKGGNPDAGEGAKAKKEEGKVGKKDAKMEKAKGDKVKMEKQQIDKQVVQNAGIMGALNDNSLSQTLGASGLSSDITGGIGGLIGAKGTQIGSGGLGARGSGLGGGGTAEGLGGLGTKGIGSGASGYGSGGGNFGQKGEGGIGAVGGDPIILGALDRSLIDEVIKRHMNQIRYCYQRELTKNPSLGGKIVIKFVIAKDGTVSSAATKSTTMNNDATQSCIEGRFLQMQFPQPKGGGIVIVSYPFLFSPG